MFSLDAAATGGNVKPLIYAIDPGPTKSAFVVWDGSRVIESGWTENGFVRQHMQDFLSVGVFWEFEDNHPPRRLAIEMVACYGMAVGAEVFQTCVEIGRFREAAGRHTGDENIQLVFRKDVKIHLCQSMRAKDANIRQSLLDRFGPVGTKKTPGPLFGVKSHVWSALAVAVTASETKEIPA
jgi:hypothetical protein